MGQLPSLALVLLLVTGLSDGRTRSPTSATSARSTPTLTDQEQLCLTQEKVLYSDGNCYKLLQKGPCATAAQWLVLNSEVVPPPGNRDRYVCSTRPCENTRQFFWPDDGECHRSTDESTLCPHAGTTLRNDLYGDGECACKPAHAQFKPDVMSANRSVMWDGYGRCYPLFRRGPCPAGNILHPNVLDGFGIVATCLRDYCSSLNHAAGDTGDVYAMHVPDRRCYLLGSRVAACGNNTYDVHPATNLPGCVWPVEQSLLSAFSDLGERCGGGNNVDPLTGRCRTELHVSTQYSPFLFDTSGKKKKRTRKRS